MAGQPQSLGGQLVGVFQDYGARRQMEQAQQAWIGALRRNPDNPEQAIAEIRPLYPQIADSVEATLLDHRTKAATAAKTELENSAKRNELAQPIVGSIRDELTWNVARKALAPIWGPDQTRLILGDKFDPAVIEQASTNLLSEQQRVAARKNAADAAIEMLKLNNQRDKDMPEILAAQTKAASAALSLATNPQEWQAAMAAQRALGVKPEVLAQFPAEFTPDAPQIAAQLSITPEKRTDQAVAQAGVALRGSEFAEEVRSNKANEANAARGASTPVSIIGPDGTPIYVSARDAIGKTPASNREQGRPVTSGDANSLADFDTALSDLDALNAAVSDKKAATGTRAAVGAALPAWVTDLTGWGTDAKKRQGVIDRVKQVIGKTLEGGVLRKEDEYKYEKILPTIRDPTDIAQSKLNGLKTAIEKRKQTTMNALEDAGYDVAKFRARAPQTSAAEPDRRPIPGIPGGEAELRDGKWIRVK